MLEDWKVVKVPHINIGTTLDKLSAQTSEYCQVSNVLQVRIPKWQAYSRFGPSFLVLELMARIWNCQDISYDDDRVKLKTFWHQAELARNASNFSRDLANLGTREWWLDTAFRLTAWRTIASLSDTVFRNVSTNGVNVLAITQISLRFLDHCEEPPHLCSSFATEQKTGCCS